jgi:hypothetical protein
MKAKGLALCCCLLAMVTLTELLAADEAAAAGRMRTFQVTAVLDEAEKEGLLWMREEEKLARDVYLAMYAIWGKQVFSNIIESEQRHMDAIKRLLDAYGIEDPAEGKNPGEFTNPAFEALYVQLVERGKQSLLEAFNVGVIIEETDIDDLELRLLTENLNPDITRVYTNLLRASKRHLEAFQTQIDRIQ